MHILITGACGFVGSTLAKGLVEAGHQVTGIDNLIRSGSHLNLASLKALGCHIIHGDIRNPSDLETLPKVDWVLDCAANASVLASVDGKTSSRQLVEHNLQGTINLLEYCRQHQAGFILLSTSRVYSIVPLTQLKLKVETEGGKNRYSPDLSRDEGPELRVECSPRPLSTPNQSQRPDRILPHHRPGLPLWCDQAGIRAARPGIRIHLRLPRLDQPLRGHGGCRTIRTACPGHLRLLDS